MAPLHASSLSAVVIVFCMCMCVFASGHSHAAKQHHNLTGRARRNVSRIGDGDNIRDAPVFLTTTSSFFSSLFNSAVLPFLDSMTKNISLPAILVQNKSSSLLVNVSAFDIDLSIQNVSFAVASPANVLMTMSGVSLTSHARGGGPHGPVDFTVQDGALVYCQGNMRAANDGQGIITLDIPLTVNRTKINNSSSTNETIDFLTVGNITFPTFQLGDLKLNLEVKQEWANILCSTVVETIRREVNGTLGKAFSDVLRTFAPTLFTEVMQRMLLTILRFPLTAPPVADPTLSGITLAMDLSDLLNVTGNVAAQQQLQQQQQEQPKQMTNGRTRPDSPLQDVQHHRQKHVASVPSVFFRHRDLSIAVTDASVNALLLKIAPKLNSQQSAGANLTTAFLRPFLPIAYERCKNCPLVFTNQVYDAATMTSALSVRFEQQNVSLVISGAVLRIQANRSSSSSAPDLIDLFSIYVDVAGSAQNWQLLPDPLNSKDQLFHFELALDDIQMMTRSSAVGPINPQVIAWVIQSLFRTTILPMLNDLLYIPLPLKPADIKIGDMSISDIVTKVENGMFVLGTNVMF